MFVFDGVVAGPLFVTERSAFAPTTAAEEALLFARFESGVVDATVAVFVTVVPSGIEAEKFTTSVNVVALPAAREAIEQLTVPEAPTAGVVQLKRGPLCPSDTKVVFAGNGSLSVTAAASDGPPFATAMV